METINYPRVGVVGCGYWGRNLVRNLAELGVLGSITDHDPDTASREASQHSAQARPWPDVLADDAISAVAIAVPAALHGRFAREALAAGKHVFVEKPLALDSAVACELTTLATNARRTLMVGHLLQYHPAFLAIRDAVEGGHIGRLQYLYSNRLNLGRFRQEEDILWSFAPHDISMILSLVGSMPTSVSAVGAGYLHKTIADVTTTHLTFPGGEQAHIFVSWLHPFKEQKLVVVGDGGMLVFDDGRDWDGKVLHYEHRVEWRNRVPQPVMAEPEVVPIQPCEPLRAELEHFLYCVRTGETPRTDGAEGVRVLSVLQAATEAMQASGPPTSRVPVEGLASASYFVHPSSYVDEGCEIGDGTKIWHFSHILNGSRLGRNCSVGQNVVVGSDVHIGNNCKLQNNVSVYAGVTLDDGVFCGPSCVFTNVVNPRAEIERKAEFRPTRVGRGATIGANATIVCGNDIGAYAMIGAGAVVTQDVPSHALMAGVPARRIGWVSHDGEHLGGDFVCSRSGRRYREIGSDRLEEVTDA